MFFKDLNRLAVLLDCNLVFYVRVGRDNATLLFFRDFRQDLDLPHCRYFVLTQNCLQESGRCLDHLVDEANYFFVRPGNFCKEDNILRGLSKICRRPDASVTAYLLWGNPTRHTVRENPAQQNRRASSPAQSFG